VQYINVFTYLLYFTGYICCRSILTSQQKSAVFPAAIVEQAAVAAARRSAEDGEADRQREEQLQLSGVPQDSRRWNVWVCLEIVVLKTLS